MKKTVILLLLIFSMVAVAAETESRCDLNATLLNQDPYPVIPGEYVKLVFQLGGITGVDCRDITFELIADYPIEFNPGETGVRVFKRVNYLKDYDSNILIPYEVRINGDALGGATEVEVQARSRGGSVVSKKFDIEVDDVRTDFEVHVKDYSYSTNEITLEVLNIEESDIEALSIEIPKQDTIQIKGASRVIVGDLDSNEYTTAEFEAKLSDGEFKINLIYSDEINVRRSVEKTVSFDSSYFTERKADEKTTGTMTYIFWLAAIVLVGWWIFKKFKKKKK
jgi:hypothetical protein